MDYNIYLKNSGIGELPKEFGLLEKGSYIVSIKIPISLGPVAYFLDNPPI
jgi:hypothetical protein